MVVSGHAAATLAGINILERGGNLVDAMVGASAALAVVVGQATSIGGDCFLLYHEAASGRSFGLNASGVAPALAAPEVFPEGMKSRGPLAGVVPGLVRAWDVMHRRFGRLPWKDLFGRAIELAHGHPVSKVLAERLPENRDALAADPGCAALYLPQGRAVAIGEILRQPALAASLQAIARQGADEFYLGDLASRIAHFQEARGGLIRAADLAAYAPLWVEPIATDYRGHQVEVMPPNSYGILLLMQLNGLSALDSETLTASLARRLGYQISAMFAAFEGVPWIADPRALPDAVERLLGPQSTAAMRARRAERGRRPKKSRMAAAPRACCSPTSMAMPSAWCKACSTSSAAWCSIRVPAFCSTTGCRASPTEPANPTASDRAGGPRIRCARCWCGAAAGCDMRSPRREA